MHTDLKMINEYIQNKTVKDITSSVIIGDMEYLFGHQNIPSIMIRMLLPRNMILLNAYSTKIKYPDENRPDVILTLPDDETVNFLFTQFNDLVEEEELEDILQGIQIALKRMNPASAFYEMGSVQSELSKICWFDYSTVALDDDIYNIMFVLRLNTTLVLGGFCCQQQSRKQWKPLVLQMLESVIGQKEELN